MKFLRRVWAAAQRFPNVAKPFLRGSQGAERYLTVNDRKA